MAALPFELISLDLDMTFLNLRSEISPRNRAAIRRCREAGARVIISSGRMHASTLSFLRALDLDTPVVSYNGAYIKHEATGDVLCHEHLDLAVAREVVEFCAGEGLHLNYYLDDRLYVSEPNRWADQYATLAGVGYEAVGDLRALTDRAPTKVLIVDEPARIAALYAALAPRYSPRSYVTTSMAEYLEFMPLGVDKGKAIAVVAGHFGIAREKVIAFGDALNDVPALRWAGLGVAMENARPEAKAVAGRIAPHHDADGVAAVLEEVFGF